MKLGSLFSGVGGFDLGFERAGMKCLWQVEFDKNCQSVLRKHWSETELFDDVRTVGKHNLKPVDVICGGFPCQDVSIAGKRAGLAGERSGLWSEFARIIDELEPKWVVVENVPGLLSSNKGRDFATVIRWLAERGYGVAWRILDSQYFGVAQRRRRVFIVGSFGDGSAAEILFEREGVRWNTEKGRKTGKTVAGTFTVRTGKEGGGKGYLGLDDGAMTLGGQPQWVMSSGQANAEITCERSPALTGLHEQPIVLGFDLAQITSKLNYSNPKQGDPQPPLNTLGQGFVAYENHPADSRITETGDISQQLTSRMGTGGGNVPLVQAVGHSGGETLKFNEKVNTLNAQSGSETTAMFNGIMAFDNYNLSATEKQASLGQNCGMSTGRNQVINSGVRRLTPTECERLQGFPDGWTDGQADSHRYKQMGNAVTVNVAEWIGKRIVRGENANTIR